MKRLLFLSLFLLLLSGCGDMQEDGAGPPAPTLPPLSAYPPMPRGLEAGQVVSVVDGDTVDVEVDGERLRLRLIGLNTPESVDPRRPVQCFGREASAQAKALLAGQSVRLESDPSQSEQDRYGRLLRYLWLADGRLFNLEMIHQGYAHEYTYSVPYKYQSAFREAEAAAHAAERGFWSADTCAGDTARPAGPPPTATPSNCDPAYPDVCIPSPPPDLDCGDIPDRAFRVLPPDPHRFDGGGDGIGCEG